MASMEVGKEVIWMRDFIEELGIRQEYRLHYNSQSVIHHAKNVAYHCKMKHIYRMYRRLRERVEDQNFTLLKGHTEEKRSHMLTKVLSTNTPNACRRRIGFTIHPIPE